MSKSRKFIIDVDAELDDSTSNSSESDIEESDPLGLISQFEGLLADFDRRRAQIKAIEDKFDFANPVMPKIKITADHVVDFIRADTTVQEFYDYVTDDGTEFDYCLNARSTRGGWTAMLAACDLQNLALVSALLAAGANPNQCLLDGKRPLDIAMENKNETLQNMLKAAGAQTGIANHSHEHYQYRKQFHDAVVNNNTDVCRDLLAKHNNEIDLLSVVINMSHYCSRQAVLNGNFELVKLLAEHGDEYIEAEHVSDKSNITVASEAGHTQIADYLENRQREVYQKLRAQIQVTAPQPVTGTMHRFFAEEADTTTATDAPGRSHAIFHA